MISDTWVALLVVAVGVVIAENLPATRRSAEALADWAARHQYAGDPERSRRRAEEWRALLRDRFALAGLATVLVFVLSYLAWSAVHQWKPMLQTRHRDATVARQKRLLRPSRGARLGLSFLDFVAYTRILLGFYRYDRLDQRLSMGWRLLRRSATFRRYFAYSVIADAGTAIQQAVLIILAYFLSHSLAFVGTIVAAQFSGPLILGPWSVVMVARLGAKRTLTGAYHSAACMSATLAGAYFAGVLNAYTIMLGALGLTCSLPFIQSARQALIAELVPPADSRAAVQLDTASCNIGRFLAIPIGALIMITQFSWAFVFGLLSCVGCAIALFRLSKHSKQVERRRRVRAMDGFQIARSDGRVMLLLLMAAALAMAADAVFVLGVGMARQLALSMGSWLDLLGMAGAGGILASLLFVAPPSFRKTSTYLACLGLSEILFGLAPTFAVACLAAMGMGAAAFHAGSDIRLLLMERVGPLRSAEVLASWSIALGGSSALAALIEGLLVTWIGIRYTAAVIAMPAICPLFMIAFAPRLSKRLVASTAPVGHGIDQEPSAIYSRQY